MCFFNRFRFQCGHQQYVLFQVCPAARVSRSLSRYYHTSCKPRRSHPNFRKWDLAGLCENCLMRQYGYGYTNSLFETGVGFPSLSLSEGGPYPYYPHGGFPAAHHAARYHHHHYDAGYSASPPFSSSRVSTTNPDLCDSPDCMTITTPKDVSSRFARSSWGRPHVGGNHHHRRYLTASSSSPDPRWWNDRDQYMHHTAGSRMGRAAPMEYSESIGGFDGIPMSRGNTFARSTVRPVQIEEYI